MQLVKKYLKVRTLSYLRMETMSEILHELLPGMLRAPRKRFWPGRHCCAWYMCCTCECIFSLSLSKFSFSLSLNKTPFNRGHISFTLMKKEKVFPYPYQVVVFFVVFVLCQSINI